MSTGLTAFLTITFLMEFARSMVLQEKCRNLVKYRILLYLLVQFIKKQAIQQYKNYILLKRLDTRNNVSNCVL
jgi:hypothetical protein